MADRIFSYLDRSISELEQLKNEYTNLFQQHPPPWSIAVKIMFRAQLKILQKNMEYWDECITKLENKAKSMRNDDAEKQELIDKIDEHNNDAGHRLLKREVSKILLEGQGYLEWEQQQPNTTANITTPSTPPSLKISSLNIQKFNGDYLKWKTFWQRFEINVHNHSFSKVEKLDALIGLLEGIALDEVAGFEIAEENYDTVVDTLKNRFGNSKLILKELHNNLRSIPPATTNAKNIRTTVNLISNMCRQLENYGVDIDNDSLQTEIIEKMPPREKNELIWFQLEKEETTTQMILEQMKKIALKAEISSQNFTKSSNSSSNNFTKTSSIPPQTFSKTPTTYPQSFMKTPQNPNRIPLQQNNNGYESSSKNFACSFCDDDHSSVRCPKFVTSDERIQQLKTKNCCTQCTKPDHNESQCESNVVCRICQGHHYSFLCNQWNNTNYQKSNNSNTFISIEAQQGCLLTKKVRVSNPITHKNIDATVLFDPGSQRSFVSDRLIRQLKLPWVAKEKLELQGIGAKAINYVSTKVKLQIKTSESFKDIFANSMPKIANSVSLVTFDENDLTKITITETTPDILIGMDYFFTFITSFERKNDLIIVHSEVGQMLSGKVQTSKSNIISTLAIEKEKQQFYRKSSYWKSKAMGSKREETNTQGKQVHEMVKKSNFDKIKQTFILEHGQMKKLNEQTKPKRSNQLQNLKRHHHHPRTFYNSNISSTIKSLIVGKQFLSIIKQEKDQCELNTNNLSGGGECPAEIKTCSSTKPPKKAHKTDTSNGEKSSVELVFDDGLVTRRSLNHLYTLEENQPESITDPGDL